MIAFGEDGELSSKAHLLVFVFFSDKSSAVLGKF